MVRDGAIYTLPAIASRGFALLLVPIYTRVLSPADYGALELIALLATIVSLTVAFEVSQGLARYYTVDGDSNRRRAYASTALWFTLLCYTVFVALALSASAFLARWLFGSNGFESIFRIGVIYIWTHGLFTLIQNQFRWDLQAVQFAITSILMIVVTAGVAIWLAARLCWGLEGVLVGQCVGCLVAATYGLVKLRSTYVFELDTTRLREMLGFSLPLVPSGVAVWISTYIDRVMINHYLEIDAVGVYSIGLRVAGIAALATVGLRGALTPWIYTHYLEKDAPQQLAAVFLAFLVAALSLNLLLSLLADSLLVVFTTPQYYRSASIVPILVPAVLLSQMYVFAPGLSIAKKTHMILSINACGALLNVLMNALFIPWIGIQGAALATLCGSGVVFLLYFVFSQRHYAIPYQLGLAALAVSIAVAIQILIDTVDWLRQESWLSVMVAVPLFILICSRLGMVPPFGPKAFRGRR
jgi:O-antigen/teichoic acid export membrane protein